MFAVRFMQVISMMVVLAALALACVPAAAEEPLDLAPNEIRAALGLFNRHTAHKVPLLSGDEIDELLAGGVVKIRQKPGTPDEPQTAVGYILIDEPRDAVWLAATDPHFQAIKNFTEYRISFDGRGNDTWYQYLHLSWPITDRHWVIDLKNADDVVEKTRGRIWELAWTLHPGGEALALRLVRENKVPGVTLKMLEGAIYIPLNRGSWVAIDLRGNRTLLVYHATTVVGGMIPDSLVVRFAMSALDELLYGVAERAPDMKAHYENGHEPWPGGDGEPLQFK